FFPECQSEGHHSITTSARVSIIVGISIPIAFAVLRFIRSSKRVGTSIGRSLGFVPLIKPPVVGPFRIGATRMPKHPDNRNSTPLLSYGRQGPSGRPAKEGDELAATHPDSSDLQSGKDMFRLKPSDPEYPL